MTHLGSFGAAVKRIEGTGPKNEFDFFGESFTVHGVIPPVLMMQLGAATTGKIEEQEGLAALWEAMRCSLTVPERFEPNPEKPGETRTVPADGEQFDKLYKLAVSQCCELEELMRLAMALFQEQTERPTGEAPASSPGQSTTSPNTNPSYLVTLPSDSPSVHPAFAHLKPVNELVNRTTG